MGAAGTDTALETADIALMSDDLLRLPFLVHLSRKTLSTIKTNIVFSLIVKAAFIGIVFLGMANLWMAVVADMGTSLVVILYGMRLITTGGRKEEGSARDKRKGITDPLSDCEGNDHHHDEKQTEPPCDCGEKHQHHDEKQTEPPCDCGEEHHHHDEKQPESLCDCGEEHHHHDENSMAALHKNSVEK